MHDPEWPDRMHFHLALHPCKVEPFQAVIKIDSGDIDEHVQVGPDHALGKGVDRSVRCHIDACLNARALFSQRRRAVQTRRDHLLATRAQVETQCFANASI